MSAIAAGGSAPARQVLIYPAALVLIIWGLFKIIKLVSK